MLHTAYTFDTTKIHFQNNNYFDSSSIPKFFYKYTYTSLKGFKSAAAGQEMRGTQSLGSTADPMFINLGGGKTIRPSEGGALTYLTAYMQHPTSPLIDNGLNLETLFGIDMGERDYFDNKLHGVSKIDIGANEFNLLKFQTLSQNKIEIKADYLNGNIFLNGQITSTSLVQQIEYQISFDGKIFSTTKSKKVNTDSLNFMFSDKISCHSNKSFYIRVQAFQKNGKILISDITGILIKYAKANPPRLYPNPVTQHAYFNFQNDVNYKTITIRNQHGQLVFNQNIDLKNKFLSIDLSHLISGIYYYEFSTADQKNTAANIFIKR